MDQAFPPSCGRCSTNGEMSTLIDAVNSFDVNTFFVVSGAVGSVVMQVFLAIAPSSVSQKWYALSSEDKRRVFIMIFLTLALADFVIKGNANAQDAAQAAINWITGVISSAALFSGTKNLIPKKSDTEKSELLDA